MPPSPASRERGHEVLLQDKIARHMKHAMWLLLGFALSIPLSADESFTLNIPVRGNASQETGRVKITLTLDAAPAGAQLLLNGTTTMALGQTLSIGGDSVTFETAG